MRRYFQILFVALTCFVLTSAAPAAQRGKGKGGGGQSSEIPGTIVMSCDAVCHDGDDTYANGVDGVVTRIDSGLAGIRLRIVRDVVPQLRFFDISIPGVREVAQGLECGSGSGSDDCVLAGFVSEDDLNPGLGYDLTAVIDLDSHIGGATDVDLPNGVLDIAEGASVQSTFILGFQVDDEATTGLPLDTRWALHWNDDVYPGSGLVNVTRNSPCTWTVWSDGSPGELAGLLLWNVGTTGKGKKNADDGNYEGRFALPFTLEFTADESACPTAP